MQLIHSKYPLLNRIVNDRFIQHLIYWSAYVCFFGLIWGSYDLDFKRTFTTELISLPPKILVVYVVAYYLMPVFLFRKRIALFWMWCFLTLTVSAVLQRMIDNWIIIRYFLPHWTRMSTLHPVAVLSTILQMSAVLAIPVTVKLTGYFSSIQRRQQELEKEKLEAELAFLKNQVQPHFLFNTLNSLYSLILKKSDLAVDVFLRLSDLLRYLLYEAAGDVIELKKEVNFVTSYLELERVRFGNSVRIDLKTKGDFEQRQIAPLLIVPFIENSIKHSTEGICLKAKVDVELSQDGPFFRLGVTNNLPEKSAGAANDYGGIGLKNVRKRLDLLYPGKYELAIGQNADTFSVDLKINLDVQ